MITKEIGLKKYKDSVINTILLMYHRIVPEDILKYFYDSKYIKGGKK